MDETYIFPERSAHAAELLRARLGEGAYGATLGPELCEQISADLFEACNDKHLRLLWHDSPEESGDEAQLVAELRELIRLENHGVRRVERLAGEHRPDRADDHPRGRDRRAGARRGDATRPAHRRR